MINRDKPKWIENQLNGKAALDNYIDYKKQQQKDFEEELKKEIDLKLSALLEEKLNELLKGF